MPGTQAQNVILVADDLQDLPPASTLADGLGEAFDEPEPLLLLGALEPHAASSAAAVSPATPTVSRAAARVADGECLVGAEPQGGRMSRELGDITG
jgi:hypothetical protein